MFKKGLERARQAAALRIACDRHPSDPVAVAYTTTSTQELHTRPADVALLSQPLTRSMPKVVALKEIRHDEQRFNLEDVCAFLLAREPQQLIRSYGKAREGTRP